MNGLKVARAAINNGIIGAAISMGATAATTAVQGKGSDIPKNMLKAAGPGFIGGAVSGGLIEAKAVGTVAARLIGGITGTVAATGVEGGTHGSTGSIIGSGTSNGVATALSTMATVDPQFIGPPIGLAAIANVVGNAAGEITSHAIDVPGKPH